MQDDKRRQREMKREIKKAGNRKMRRHLDRDLARDPEHAHEAEFDYGQSSSAGLNGMDHDSTRKREEEE